MLFRRARILLLLSVFWLFAAAAVFYLPPPSPSLSLPRLDSHAFVAISAPSLPAAAIQRPGIVAALTAAVTPANRVTLKQGGPGNGGGASDSGGGGAFTLAPSPALRHAFLLSSLSRRGPPALGGQLRAASSSFSPRAPPFVLP